MLTLQIVLASTREGRAGAPVAEWFTERARAHAGFAVELVDLKQVNLPLLDEPNLPNKQQYQHAHTKAWSAIVSRADAFAFVVPEYNGGVPPSLLNALDYLFVEWNYKPATFVSYGGMFGGGRSVQMVKPVMTTLKMMPIPDSLSFPYFSKLITDGTFAPDATAATTAGKVLDELLRWATALKTLRT